jgi:hypothetical protein
MSSDPQQICVVVATLVVQVQVTLLTAGVGQDCAEYVAGLLVMTGKAIVPLVA